MSGQGPIKFIIVGQVVPRDDGQWRYVPPTRLARLYGINTKEAYLIDNRFMTPMHELTLPKIPGAHVVTVLPEGTGDHTEPVYREHKRKLLQSDAGSA
jgi:hypothetical protein